MRTPRIYLPCELSPSKTLELNDHAFQHIIKVLRMKTNEKVFLFDGKGNEYTASLDEINKKNAYVIVHDKVKTKTESKLSIHLGLGISKSEKMDFAIQKSVELGVTTITPLFTEHCVIHLNENRIKKRLAHWQGIIVSACEQSGRNVLPTLNSIMTLMKWADSINDICLVFDPLATTSLQQLKPKNGHISLIIGPEGGLSSNEILELDKKEGFYSVKFGPRILRTETAAISAITALQILWGDLLE